MFKGVSYFSYDSWSHDSYQLIFSVSYYGVESLAVSRLICKFTLNNES